MGAVLQQRVNTASQALALLAFSKKLNLAQQKLAHTTASYWPFTRP
jgi:hypothetical protein